MSSVSFGAPIEASLFRGRVEAVRTITGRLNNANFSSTSVVGGPRTGKSSLLRYLASESASGKIVGAAKMLRIYIDVETIGTGMTPFDFWISVLRQVRSQSNGLEPLVSPVIAKAVNKTMNMYDLEDLFEGLEGQGLRLAVLVEHWDTVLRNASFWPPASNFLHLIRYFGQGSPRRTVAWVLASERPLLDLWDSNRGASPYYNIFETVKVASLADEEVKQFTQAAFMRSDAELELEVMEFIQKASCGHPYLLNFLVSCCLDHYAASGDVDLASVLGQFAEDDGPLVSLIRQIRGAMSGVERQLFDKSVGSAESLTVNERKKLTTLASYGLLPPRPRT
jgi:hypothetical protein